MLTQYWLISGARKVSIDESFSVLTSIPFFMNNVLRWSLKSLVVLLGVILCGIFAIYFVFFSGSDVEQAARNSSNSYRIKIGMSRHQVLSIMGPPIRIEPRPQQPGTVYVYATSALASHEIAVVLGPDSLVATVYHGY